MTPEDKRLEEIKKVLERDGDAQKRSNSHTSRIPEKGEKPNIDELPNNPNKKQ